MIVTNYNNYTKLLLATKIVQSKDNEIARKHSHDQIISTHYQYTKFWFRMSLHNDLLHPKFSLLTMFLC